MNLRMHNSCTVRMGSRSASAPVVCTCATSASVAVVGGSLLLCSQLACSTTGLCHPLRPKNRSSPPPAPTLPHAADSEGASFSTMPEYVQWVTKSYGDPANTKKPECLDLKSKLCGARDTSEVSMSHSVNQGRLTRCSCVASSFGRRH
jgi:hypothetical protein